MKVTPLYKDGDRGRILTTMGFRKGEYSFLCHFCHLLMTSVPLHTNANGMDIDLYADDTTITASAEIGASSKLRESLTIVLHEVDNWANIKPTSFLLMRLRRKVC